MNVGFPTLEELEKLGPTRAAAVWLERLARQESDGNDGLFLGWLNASEANRLAWDHALDLWDGLDEDEENSLAAMRHEALAFRHPRFSTPWWRYGAVASIALVVLVALLFNVGRPFDHQADQQVAGVQQPDPQRFGTADYVTRTGQKTTFALSDGSKVTLDTDSAVDLAYAKGLRLVRLVRGQAFFEVAHDATHPFRVAAGGRVISVLGTRFNVRLATGETRVLLVQGVIAVSRSDDPARPGEETGRLAPGEQLIARAGVPDEIRRVKVEPSMEWQRGFVQFDRQTLGTAVEELNRYTEKKLVVRDPWVAALRISGAFPTGDSASFVQTITALYPLRVVPAAGGKVEIARKP